MKATACFKSGFCAALSSVLLVALFSGCSKESANVKTERPPVPVSVATVEVKDVPVEIHAVGNVHAYSSVAVRSQITGPIVGVHFEEGSEVKAGDLLFTIDPRSLEGALNQARANVKRDEAQLLSSRLEFQRTSNLFHLKIASQQDYDTAEAAFGSAEASVLADSAAVSNAQVTLGYTQIRSPIDGRTGDLKVKAGNVVKAPDDVLVNLTQIHPIHVTFSVPERNLPAIRQRMREATLPVTAIISGEEKSSHGDLTFVNNAVDMNTGTILLKATFANEDNALWPGQFVETSVTLNTLKQAMVVPSQAVQIGQNGEYVFVVKPDSTAEVRTNLATGASYDGQTVITRGVKPGETVVIDGQLKLTPGAKLSVKNSDAEGSSTNTAAATP